jgi:HPt (histidine-containing phosphotransfer) domain-containing protein
MQLARGKQVPVMRVPRRIRRLPRRGADELKTFDLDWLLRVVKGNQEGACELIGVYLDAKHQQFAELALAMESDDRDMTRHLFHSIKGASKQMGILRLGGMAEEMEHLAEMDKLDMCKELMKGFEREYQEVQSELNAYRDSIRVSD